MYKNYASVATCTFCNSVFLLLHFLNFFLLGFLYAEASLQLTSFSSFYHYVSHYVSVDLHLQIFFLIF